MFLVFNPTITKFSYLILSYFPLGPKTLSQNKSKVQVLTQTSNKVWRTHVQMLPNPLVPQSPAMEDNNVIIGMDTRHIQWYSVY